MDLIQSLKNEFCFDLPMFSKYLATSINSYLTLLGIQTSIWPLKDVVFRGNTFSMENA